MKKITLLSVFLILIAWAPLAWSLPVLNSDGSGPIDGYEDGSSYGTYTNSGELLFIEEGNNEGSPSNRAWVESLVEASLGLSPDFELVVADVEYYLFDDGLTGTWYTVNPADQISLYAVKAGKAFAMYSVLPGDSSGSWSTFDLWMSGLANSGDALEISHFTGYNASTSPVPEPATMILLGTGLVGLAGFGRKKIRS